MTYDEISPTLRAFIGGREAFRKMGFKADDLYCNIAMSMRFRRLMCFVQLKAQNNVFNLEVGPVEDGDAFGAEYRRVAEAICAGQVPQDDLDRMWQESEPYTNPLGFTKALLGKGFKPPKSLS